jgi:uncharacterized iron-regulated protein
MDLNKMDEPSLAGNNEVFRRSIWKNQAVRICGVLAAAGLFLAGCAVTPKMNTRRPAIEALPPGTIISGRTGQAVSFDAMLADLSTVAVIYVGEKHTAAAHHEGQLRVIRELHFLSPRLAVAMEMFDRSYQAVLDRWSAGELDEDDFLRSSHWYANWRFDYALYREILEYTRVHHIRLVALNLPFNIPPKIRVGGTNYLLDYEKGFLPEEIDTTVSAHRNFAEQIFRMHDFKGNVRFEDFYLAQCVWEDVMAESVAKYLDADRMVVLAGNGHIQFKYGIPERAFKRNSAPYLTIYQASVGEEVDPSIADFIWFND